MPRNFTGLLVVLCWSCVALSGTAGWSLLGLLVFELVALVTRFTVVLTVGRRLPSVAHAPNLAGGRWHRPGIGWGSPVEGQAPMGPIKPPPRRRRLLLGVLSDLFQLGQEDCFDIRRNHDAPHNLWPKLDRRCGKEFI